MGRWRMSKSPSFQKWEADPNNHTGLSILTAGIVSQPGPSGVRCQADNVVPLSSPAPGYSGTDQSDINVNLNKSLANLVSCVPGRFYG